MVANLGNSDNLPKVDVTINDFGLRIAPPDLGPKVTIIGGFNHAGGTVPLNEPLQIQNMGVAMRNLRNDDGTPSELTLAIEEVLGGGASNIEVVVSATGRNTPYEGTIDSSYVNALHSELETTYDNLLNHDVDVVYLASAYADGFATVDGFDTGTAKHTGLVDHASGSNFAKQLADFCYQQTKESNSAFGVIGVTPISKVAKQLMWQENSATSVTSFSGSEGAYFDVPSLALVKEYVNYLTQETGDTGIFNGTSSSDTGTYPDVQAALYAKWNTYLYGSVQGSDITLPNSTYISEFQAKDIDGSLATDTDGNKVDAGAYISVIGGVSRAFGSEATKFAALKGASTLTYVNSNGAAGFAGLLANTAPYIGTTNTAVNSISQLRSISAKQAKDLLRHRIVSMINKPAGYVVTSGITGAFNAGSRSRSDFVRITTTRTTQAMAEVVRDAGEAFIGKPISGPFLAALESAIDTNLQKAVRRGAIRAFDFALSSSPDQQVLGEVSIDLSMIPAFELVTINTTVSLSKGEGLG